MTTIQDDEETKTPIQVAFSAAIERLLAYSRRLLGDETPADAWLLDDASRVEVYDDMLIVRDVDPETRDRIAAALEELLSA